MILRQGRRLLAATVLSVAMTAMASGMAMARTNYAMVVGVTDYPQLSRNNWLIGPANDAVLVRDFLTTQSHVPFEPGNVTLLADGVEGAQEPTLERILASLDDIAGKVERDDFVYLQLSGHGFQQTAADPSTETDGLDEIFLPKDTGRWVDRSKGMPNVLTDDQIGKALDRIRARGAFVWFVIDACHSGTATRAAPGDDVVERKIGPDAVGMPSEVLMEGAATRDLGAREVPVEVSPTSAQPVEMGGMVAFFAAQTNETTPEMPLPAGEEGARKYGLFTYTLFSKLGENPNVSYRQLAQGILQHYASINRTATTPLFEGDLDAPVFGTRLDGFVPQWPVSVGERGAVVSGGRLHGLIPGARLAILKDPAARDEDAVGYLEVRSADNFTSRVSVVAPDEPAATSGGAGTAAARKVRSVADIPPGAYARLAASTFDFTLTVALPEGSGEFPRASTMVQELLEAIAADETKPLRIELVDPGKPANLRLALFSEASLPDAAISANADPTLWFLPESGEVSMEQGRRPPSIIMASGDRKAIGDEIAHYLTSIYRATNLARLGAGSDYGPDEVPVAFTLRRWQGEEEEISATSAPLASPQDRVAVTITNNTGTPVDVNILYIGSDYSIGHMHPNTLVRLQPQATFEREFLEFTDESYGRELMVAVISEAQPLTATQDLRFLAQDGLRQAMRGGGAPGIGDLVEMMGMGSTSRAAKAVGGPEGGTPRGAVLLVPVQTVPRS